MRLSFRKYKVSDSLLLQTAGVFHDFYVRYESEFFAFSNVLFKASFKTDFEADIEAAHSVLKDLEVVGDIAIETQEFTIKRRACEASYQELKFFVRKAFPNDAEVWDKFGFSTYQKAKLTQDGFIKFMEALVRTAKKYKSQLAAQGYTQARINQLNALVNELKLEETQQEELKSNRPVITRQRTDTMNKVWNRMLDIHRASRLIYRDDYAMLHIFDLPVNRHRKSARYIKAATDQHQLKEIVLKMKGVEGVTVTVGLGDGNVVKVLMDGVSLQEIVHSYKDVGDYMIKVMSGVADISEWYSDDCRLTALNVPKKMKKLTVLSAENNNFTTKVVDQILKDVNKLKTYGGKLKLGGNASPSVDGLHAKSDLESRGWTVTVN